MNTVIIIVIILLICFYLTNSNNENFINNEPFEVTFAPDNQNIQLKNLNAELIKKNNDLLQTISQLSEKRTKLEQTVYQFQEAIKTAPPFVKEKIQSAVPDIMINDLQIQTDEKIQLVDKIVPPTQIPVLPSGTTIPPTSIYGLQSYGSNLPIYDIFTSPPPITTRTTIPPSDKTKPRTTPPRKPTTNPPTKSLTESTTNPPTKSTTNPPSKSLTKSTTNPPTTPPAGTTFPSTTTRPLTTPSAGTVFPSITTIPTNNVYDFQSSGTNSPIYVPFTSPPPIITRNQELSLFQQYQLLLSTNSILQENIKNLDKEVIKLENQLIKLA